MMIFLFVGTWVVEQSSVEKYTPDLCQIAIAQQCLFFIINRVIIIIVLSYVLR